ncbi:helix-turn-helix domain-containing protein [Alkalihalophilus pseudofirmus]|uniref:helix-turn-helix domain-containing protein n=1 Tax=Alkalihalophilus pseudofirmus TaxID=79885 RepID=UPI00259AF9A4|nr:helix-turn-helix domain-containing protein [Alkalihalophilus pseudofirmus]WEG18652.1 helix-turn-helix domain-containing protein [Alkalihalophilus pseudofirmus]
MNKMAKRLKWLRGKHKLAQKEVAAELDISMGGYQKIEYGERLPSVEVLASLAELFDVSIDFLVGNINQTNQMLNLKEEIIRMSGAKDVDLVLSMIHDLPEEEENEAWKHLNEMQNEFYGFIESVEYKLKEDMESYFDLLLDMPDANIKEDSIVILAHPFDFYIQNSLVGDKYIIMLNNRLVHGVEVFRTDDLGGAEEVRHELEGMFRIVPRSYSELINSKLRGR